MTTPILNLNNNIFNFPDNDRGSFHILAALPESDETNQLGNQFIARIWAAYERCKADPQGVCDPDRPDETLYDIFTCYHPTPNKGSPEGQETHWGIRLDCHWIRDSLEQHGPPFAEFMGYVELLYQTSKEARVERSRRPRTLQEVEDQQKQCAVYNLRMADLVERLSGFPDFCREFCRAYARGCLSLLSYTRRNTASWLYRDWDPRNLVGPTERCKINLTSALAVDLYTYAGDVMYGVIKPDNLEMLRIAAHGIYLYSDSPRAIDETRTELIRAMIRALEASTIAYLPDYRADNITYKMYHLVAITFIGLMIGDNCIGNLQETMLNKPDLFRRYLGVTEAELPRLPNAVTLRRAMADIPHDKLQGVIKNWSEILELEEMDHMAMDGKAFRAAVQKCLGKTRCPLTLNGFDGDNNRIVLHTRVNCKRNEHSTSVKFIQSLGYALQGVTVSADAAFTYTDVMSALEIYKAHYVLALRDNQSTLLEKIQKLGNRYIYTPDSPTLDWYVPDDNDKRQHGRVTERFYTVITDGVEELVKGTRFEGHVHSIGVLVRYSAKVRYDKNHVELPLELKDPEICYYLCSHGKELTAERFARYARGHWNASEIFHFVLDTELNEDRCTLHKGDSMENFGLMRKAVVSVCYWLKRTLTVRVSFGDIRRTIRDLGGVPADWVTKKPEQHKELQKLLEKTERNLRKFYEKRWRLILIRATPLTTSEKIARSYAPLGARATAA